MIRTALAVLALLASAAEAGAPGLCGRKDPTLIYASCDSARPGAALRLLPEDAGPTPERALDVTGAYTATDARAEGKPKPVGLFIRGGEIVSREYVRFDGVLTVVEGRPALHYRRAVEFGGRAYDLEDAAARAAFLSAVAAAKGDLMQSHLLIIEGRVDTSAVENAPRFRRRILFETEDGVFGLFDSSPRPLTLHEAAEEVADRFAPRMALNLDMGSFDFCRRGAALCGALRAADTAKLSNLLRLY